MCCATASRLRAQTTHGDDRGFRDGSMGGLDITSPKLPFDASLHRNRLTAGIDALHSTTVT
tara:strand:+ start:587 stop:769 length:183 start_codon:yes stop_codon:yes gene_type:complete